jgi:hypothetical protein
VGLGRVKVFRERFRQINKLAFIDLSAKARGNLYADAAPRGAGLAEAVSFAAGALCAAGR